MPKVSPVTQIAMRKHLEFKYSLCKSRKLAQTSGDGSQLLKSLSILAILAGTALLSNCSKEIDIKEERNCVSNFSDKISNYLNLLGLIDLTQSSNEVKNIGFTDENSYRHILVQKENSEEQTKIQHLKVNPLGHLTNISELILTPEQNFINIDTYSHNGDFLHTKKYEISGEKIIEYSDYNDIFVAASEYYKTENGFEQKLMSGEINSFKDIKSNEETPDTSIIVDESLNEIIHEIVLQ